MIPRLDPSTFAKKNKGDKNDRNESKGPKKPSFLRAPQKAFSAEDFKGCDNFSGPTVKDGFLNKHFYILRNMQFRKGFIYRPYSLK